ncbi:MAG: hypothetical protein Q8N65_00110 [bacterium]|nr:hypothetical protein [bacterium]
MSLDKEVSLLLSSQGEWGEGTEEPEESDAEEGDGTVKEEDTDDDSEDELE